MIPVVIEMAKLRARIIERNWRELALSTLHMLSHASANANPEHPLLFGQQANTYCVCSPAIFISSRPKVL